MDPIAPTTDDAAPTSAADPNDLARTRATTGPAPAPAPDDAAADSAAPVVEGGTLAEVESLRGVLITSSGDAEVEALRRSLELDDQPEAAAPTNDEQAEYADILRQEVTAPPPNADRAGDDRDGEVPGDPDGPPLDPTEAFEVHDAAVAGDAIAQAIEDASRQRTATAEATINRTREERTQADAALERRQALARADERADTERLDGTRREDEAARLRRDVQRGDTALQRDREVQRDDASLLAQDRTTQLSAAAGAAHFGAGRPPARIEDRGDEEETADDAPVERPAPIDRVVRARRGR